ncbi:DUF2913 family protein [Photorhabdus sp. RM71S]|uniref:DUF2913 family protein n=1 Tax=Photorhabdus sp. RM71S TaxID=3342824 RepID=UPI0036DB8264
MTTDTTELLGHFAWCAQIALGIARKDKKVTSPIQEHIFLMNWMNTARKKKFFPKAIAAEIDYLIQTGKQSGPLVNLKKKITYIYKSSRENVLRQSDLFRLTYAIESLKNDGWYSYTVSPGDWKKRWKAPHSPALYMDKNALNEAFNYEGKQLKPVPIRVDGDHESVTIMFSKFHIVKKGLPSKEGILMIEPWSTNS